jgi:hypothetical protein
MGFDQVPGRHAIGGRRGERGGEAERRQRRGEPAAFEHFRRARAVEQRGSAGKRARKARHREPRVMI